MYHSQLKADILVMLQAFYAEEKGNRITSFNFAGLLHKLQATIDKRQIVEAPPTPASTPTETEQADDRRSD